MPNGLLCLALGAVMQVGSPGPSENPYTPALPTAYGQYGSEGSSEPRFAFDGQQNWVHGYFQELPAYGGYPVFRPYNYKHVLSQSQTAAGWGERPTMPYSQQFWHKYHDQATMLKATQYAPPMRSAPTWNAPYQQANTTYQQANTPSQQGNTSYLPTNATYQQVNAPYQQGNASYQQMNAPVRTTGGWSAAPVSTNNTPASAAPATAGYYHSPQNGAVMPDQPRIQMPAVEYLNPPNYQPGYGRGY